MKFVLKMYPSTERVKRLIKQRYLSTWIFHREATSTEEVMKEREKNLMERQAESYEELHKLLEWFGKASEHLYISFTVLIMNELLLFNSLSPC